VDDGIAA